MEKSLQGQYTVQYRSCIDCGATFQNYPLTAKSVSEYYEILYKGRIFMYRGKAVEEAKRNIGEFAIEIMGLTARQQVLDVGSAEGYGIAAMSELGVEAFGVEPSRAMGDYARTELQLPNVQTAQYSRETYPQSSFDGICIFHVIEHVTDPTSMIRTARYHLKEGGRLFVEVPSVGASANAFEGGHITAWTAESLGTLLRANGFNVEMLVTNNPGQNDSLQAYANASAVKPGAIVALGTATL